ncbi:hypothetical protein ElyMa_001359500 [Elysia marginata]|uniref:Uncharacterized protein n=1 Tax=Elysia marginata TaxID=1093978 RepID=A0AAV4ITW0_9GAST|nr:hypothetical protein ElyMa_001359500 [Elysia marginata]
MTLQGSKQMKVRGCDVWTVARIRTKFPIVALQPLLGKVCFMRSRIIVLKNRAHSQESRSFATNCIPEAVKSAAVLAALIHWPCGMMSMKIAPFASQNT